MFNLQSFSATHSGKVRSENEDYIFADTQLSLFIVCDGMGGAAHGRLASESAGSAAAEHIANHKRSLQGLGEEQLGPVMLHLVREAIQKACQRLQQLVSEHPEAASMGTTLTLLLIEGTKGAMGHVGDSRLYLLRDKVLHQLSRDHTLVGELVEAGEITPEEARHHPFAHVLTRAIGRDPAVRADTLVFDLLPNDCFLLCSDGLWAPFSEQEPVSNTLADTSPKRSTESLLATALEADGSDNLSAIVVRLESQAHDEPSERSRQEFVNLSIQTLKQVYLFEDLPMDAIFQIVNISTVRHCAQSELLIREGETGASLYIILEGSVAVIHNGTAIARFGPGKHFGEMALLSPAERSASVKALEQSTLLIIAQKDLRQLIASSPTLGVSLLWRLGAELSNRLRATNKYL